MKKSRFEDIKELLHVVSVGTIVGIPLTLVIIGISLLIAYALVG